MDQKHRIQNSSKLANQSMEITKLPNNQNKNNKIYYKLTKMINAYKIINYSIDDHLFISIK
jgi:hypothetical protein